MFSSDYSSCVYLCIKIHMNVLILIFIIYYILCCSDANALNRHSNVKSNNDSDIVGGRVVVDIMEYPYLVTVVITFTNGAFECTGTILSFMFVLTAGHCFSGLVNNIEISVGSEHNRGGTLYLTVVFHKHPHYGVVGHGILPDYDAAIVEIKDTMKLNGFNSRAIDLIDEDSGVPPFTIVDVVGWGASEEDKHTVSKLLRAVKVPVQDHELCVHAYKADNVRITPRMMCIGFIRHSGKGACLGDSGGPAITGLGIQIGLVSASIGCGKMGFPAIFTNVAVIRDWIKEVAKV